MTRAQINLTPDTYAKVAEIAKALGYIQKGGPRSGEGSPVKMLEAVARGELIIDFSPNHSQHDSHGGRTENQHPENNA